MSQKLLAALLHDFNPYNQMLARKYLASIGAKK